MKISVSKPFIYYLLRFGILFSLFYFGTLLIIGLSSKDNFYSPFVANYLNFIPLLRSSLLYFSKFLLNLAGYNTHLTGDFTLSLENGAAVKMVYSCIGYGVLSFWTAFVLANNGTFQKKALWAVGGCLALSLLNTVRVAILLVAISKNWPMPFNLDHHTLFNIFAYGLIFLMIYMYDKSFGKEQELR